ncbi:MAG: hypothetical protein WBL63_24765 [Candidatus Acidiferrum sp.]
MTHEHRLRFKTLLMVLLMVACANLGDLMLKRGMLQIGAVQISAPGIWHALLSTIHNGTIWLGILFLIGFTLCYMTAVSWADYSYVMPAGAFGYAVQTTLAVVILHEVVNAQRWFGVVLIVVGVLLVGQTHPSTTKPRPVAS